jgi:ApaG protein
MYVEKSENFEIEVRPEYLTEHSRPESKQFVFGYQVTIRNQGQTPARLVSRHWIITDGEGKTHEVKGPGVIGETPRIDPGAEYQYASFCPLTTPTGNMRGSYEMVRDDGSNFSVKIPLFFLRDLRQFH